MDTDTLIGRVIIRSHAIDKLLRKHYPEAKGGLHAALNSLADTLPAILMRAIRVVATVRNDAAHPDGFNSDTVPPDFDRLCNEIELLIPYFASQQHAGRAHLPKAPKPPAPKPPAPKRPARKPPTAPKPPTAVAIVKPQKVGVATKAPANHGKPWTPAEDKMLVDAFDAQTTIPELAKAHQRGVGGVQNRLTKLGKLTADQFKTYPESQ